MCLDTKPNAHCVKQVNDTTAKICSDHWHICQSVGSASVRVAVQTCGTAQADLMLNLQNHEWSPWQTANMTVTVRPFMSGLWILFICQFGAYQTSGGRFRGIIKIDLNFHFMLNIVLGQLPPPPPPLPVQTIPLRAIPTQTIPYFLLWGCLIGNCHGWEKSEWELSSTVVLNRWVFSPWG